MMRCLRILKKSTPGAYVIFSKYHTQRQIPHTLQDRRDLLRIEPLVFSPKHFLKRVLGRLLINYGTYGVCKCFATQPIEI